MIKVDSFIFGSIIINGRKFGDDVTVAWDGEVITKKSAHAFSVNDLRDMLIKAPEVVIIGTGTAGQVKIDPNVQITAGVEGVELIIKPTAQAIEEFNRQSKRRKVIASFHLTC